MKVERSLVPFLNLLRGYREKHLKLFANQATLHQAAKVSRAWELGVPFSWHGQHMYLLVICYIAIEHDHL